MILYKGNKEAGFVSLFSTIFFMLLITVITLGFLRIMGLEQRQSLDNELSASAVTAAESGIEDGKRAILKYYSLPDGDALKAELRTALTSDQCDALTQSATIRNSLGLHSEGNVINNPQLNQYYTCLTVNLQSPDFVAQTSAGNSEIVPLRAASGNYTSVKVEWHLISENPGSDGDGIPAGYAPGISLPPLTGSGPNTWTSLGYPSYLRVQLIGHPNGSFDRNALQQRNRATLLVPGTDGATTIALDAADPNPGIFGEEQLIPRRVQCRLDPGGNLGSYACSATLDLPSGAEFAGNNNTYFLRVTPIYGPSHFRVALVNDSGDETPMTDVQPIVDATGRAADVFRRLQARVRINPITTFPEYVAESAEDICKVMQLSDNPADYVGNICNP